MLNRFRLSAIAACLAVALGAPSASAQISFNNVVTGEALDLETAPPDGKDSAAFKEFLQSGKNPYNNKQNCFAKGEELYNGACSGCHGHVAEGKLGPGLNDAYWTYPANITDKGMFETIFGGAQGMMGPMVNSLNVQEMLLAMAWIRHMYKDDPAKAEWLEADARQSIKPYKGEPAPKPGADAPEECKMGG